MLRAIRTDKPYKVFLSIGIFELENLRQGRSKATGVLEQELQDDTDEPDVIGAEVDYEELAHDIKAVKHNKHYGSVRD